VSAGHTLQHRVGRTGRRLSLPVLRGADVALQRSVRPRPDVVCYASMPDFSDSAHAVHRHLLETREDLEHLWLVRDPSTAERIRREFAGAEARGHRLRVAPWTMRSYPAFLRAGTVFHTHGVFGFSPPGGDRVSVSLWHGMPVKAIRRLHHGDHDLFPVHGTLHLATSSFFRYIIAGAFDVHPSDVLVSGLPRCDVLKGVRPSGHHRAAIAAALGLDPGRRWVLWMPTHRSEPDRPGSTPARTFLEATDAALVDALDRAAARHDALVVVKLHPFDLLNDRPVELAQRNLSLVTSPRWQATGIQLYDLVAASDALLTDLSSIFVDYLHTGNPIGVLGGDIATYTRDTLFDPDLLLRCRSASALRTADDVEAFVAGMSDLEGEPSDDGDLSVVFNEDHGIASTATVVDAAGL